MLGVQLVKTLHHPSSSALSLQRMSAPGSPITDVHNILILLWWAGTVSRFPATSLSLWCSTVSIVWCLPWDQSGTGVIHSLKSTMTQWRDDLVVCSSCIGMAPGALEIPAWPQRAWDGQACLGHNELQSATGLRESAILTASVEEYKSIWNKACSQMTDISNWTTSKRHCSFSQKNYSGSYVWTRMFNHEMYFCGVVHYWCQKWMPEFKQFLLLFDTWFLWLRKLTSIYQHPYNTNYVNYLLVLYWKLFLFIVPH